MSSQDNYGIPNSFRNDFPLRYENDLPHFDQGESMFPSLSNGGNRRHASPTLPPPPPLTSPCHKLNDIKLLKPYWHANIKMKILCVCMF